MGRANRPEPSRRGVRIAHDRGETVAARAVLAWRTTAGDDDERVPIIVTLVVKAESMPVLVCCTLANELKVVRILGRENPIGVSAAGRNSGNAANRGRNASGNARPCATTTDDGVHELGLTVIQKFSRCESYLPYPPRRRYTRSSHLHGTASRPRQHATDGLDVCQFSASEGARVTVVVVCGGNAGRVRVTVTLPIASEGETAEIEKNGKAAPGLLLYPGTAGWLP